MHRLAAALVVTGVSSAGTSFAQGAAGAAAPASIDSAPSGAAPAAGAASDPRRAVTALEQARRVHREGRPDEALRLLDGALKDNPRDPQLRFLYGTILNERGRGDDAFDVFRQLTQDFPELPEPFNNLAVLYAGRGELEMARAALEDAIRAAPGYALAHENLGDIFMRLAARSYERAAGSPTAPPSAATKLSLARDLIQRLDPSNPPRGNP